MKLFNSHFLLLWTIWVLSWWCTFALTDPLIKEQELGIDLYLESSNLVFTEPDRFVASELETASRDASYWIDEVLPYPEDRNKDLYVVVPQLWLVAPIVVVPEDSIDFHTMKSGREIAINKYLQNGVLQYVGSVQPWYWWKRIDFAHSNYYMSDPGRYKSVFATLMALDPGDEFWYFQRQWSTYQLYRYQVTKSFHIWPSNTSVLQRDGEWADALLFWCTHGIDGRWVVEWTYIWESLGKPPSEYNNLSYSFMQRVDKAVQKIGRLTTNEKVFVIIKYFKALETIKKYYALTGFEEQAVDYIQTQLALIYPE